MGCPEYRAAFRTMLVPNLPSSILPQHGTESQVRPCEAAEPPHDTGPTWLLAVKEPPYHTACLLVTLKMLGMYTATRKIEPNAEHL